MAWGWLFWSVRINNVRWGCKWRLRWFSGRPCKLTSWASCKDSPVNSQAPCKLDTPLIQVTWSPNSDCKYLPIPNSSRSPEARITTWSKPLISLAMCLSFGKHRLAGWHIWTFCIRINCSYIFNFLNRGYIKVLNSTFNYCF